MEQFFPQDKLIFTGNPIRRESVAIAGKREEALASFGLSSDRKTILVTGGSLGAKTLNDCVIAGMEALEKASVQVIWQCGSYYYQALQAQLAGKLPSAIVLLPFLQRMDYAYAAADVIVSRAGAGTISELCVIGKPVVLVPSPNVAEDHQTKNAQALVAKQAAILVADRDARETLVATVVELLQDETKSEALGKHIQQLAKLEADEVIAKEVLKLIK